MKSGMNKFEAPFTIDAAFLGKLLRYELTYADFQGQVVPEDNWICEEYHIYSLEDMQALAENLKVKNPDAQALKDWIHLVFKDLDAFYMYSESFESDKGRKMMGVPYPLNDAAMIEDVCDAFRNCLIYEGAAQAYADLILKDLENYRLHKPIQVHLWTVGNRLATLQYADPKLLKCLSSEEKQELKTMLLDLAGKDYEEGLKQLGYCYYGGHELFACDWYRAHKCFLRLMEKEDVGDLDKCRYANTLGYIYYYGRCNRGIPEYDKAFLYFSLGASGGFYESTYKLADMYLHGYYTPKNNHAAAMLISDVYDECLHSIETGDFGSPFADAALRMGNLCRDGIVKKDPYYFYTLADYAIRKRMQFNQYGDDKVFFSIQGELAKIREMRPLSQADMISSRIPFAMAELFQDHACNVILETTQKGILIAAQRLANPGCEKAESVFECYADFGYCELIDTATILAVGYSYSEIGKKTFIADEFECEYTEDETVCTFLHHGEEIITLHVSEFVRALPEKEGSSDEYRFASVVFQTGGRSYDYICDLDDVQVGDTVVVMGNGEEKEVEVVRLFQMNVSDMPLPLARYKRVLRKA